MFNHPPDLHEQSMTASADAQFIHPPPEQDHSPSQYVKAAIAADHAAIAAANAVIAHAKKGLITIKNTDPKPFFGKATPRARINHAESSLVTLEDLALQLAHAQLKSNTLQPTTAKKLSAMIATVQTHAEEQQQKMLDALLHEHEATAATTEAAATKFFADAHKKEAAAVADAKTLAATNDQMEKQWRTGGLLALGGGRRRKATRRRHSQKAGKARSNKKPRHNKPRHKKRRTKRRNARKGISRTRSRQSMVGGGWGLPEWLGGKKTEASTATTDAKTIMNKVSAGKTHPDDAYNMFAHNANALTHRNTQLMYKQNTAEKNLTEVGIDTAEHEYLPVKGSSPDDRGIKDWRNKILAREGNPDAKLAQDYHNKRNENSQAVNELSRHMSTLYPLTTKGMVAAQRRATIERGDVFADGTAVRTGREIRPDYDPPLGGGRRRTLRNRAK
jgi:hypothetical protein